MKFEDLVELTDDPTRSSVPSRPETVLLLIS
jgi:hypothetical protein